VRSIRTGVTISFHTRAVLNGLPRRLSLHPVKLGISLAGNLANSNLANSSGQENQNFNPSALLKNTASGDIFRQAAE
jgi:hypothetical protein